MKPRRQSLLRSATREDWLAQERRSLQIRFPRQPQAVILFPAPYPTGVANLGFLTIWQKLNSIPDFSCDRAFWDPKCPELRGLKTSLPLKAFPLIFISSSFELDLGEVIKALLAAGIEPWAAKRGSEEPIIVAGGMSLSLNPAPWGPVIDLALLGEGEELIESWISVYLNWQDKNEGRQDLVSSSAELEGVWIPGCQERKVVPAVYIEYPNDPAYSPAVHPRGHFGDCWLVELTRGCPRGCLFCAVCGVYPARFAQADAVLEKLQECNGLGAPKVGLVGGAVGDHPALKSLVLEIIAGSREITISSLRIERSDSELLELLVRGGLKTLTVAPETGGEDLRRRLGKKATNEELIQLAMAAERAGIKTLRLYFLIGLPEGEPPTEIIKLTQELRRKAPGRLKLDLSISSFIPKPGTPWEREPFADIGSLDEIKGELRFQLRTIPGVKVNCEATKFERVAALLSRGDAALGKALLRAIQAGRPLEQEMRISGMEAERYLDFTNWEGVLPWAMIGRHK